MADRRADYRWFEDAEQRPVVDGSKWFEQQLAIEKERKERLTAVQDTYRQVGNDSIIKKEIELNRARKSTPKANLPDYRTESLQIIEAPHGGYFVREGNANRDPCGLYMCLAAFTTLDEALKWIKRAFERPVPARKL